MKILLVTDTHGQLARLNELAREHCAEAIVHAGDFGFYDDASVDRLSDREIWLRILHSDLSAKDKKRIQGKSRDEQRQFVRDRLPLSDLPSFLSGETRFETPVYAVWGNHEDVEVLKRFRSGKYRVQGLHILHEQATFRVEGLHIFGLGGNFLMGRKLFQEPIAGGGGRVWSVLSQYLRLLDTVRANALDGERRILVSHVSSGKEAFITLLAIHLAADLVVSGHMAPPFSMIWNDFAVRSPEQAVSRVKERLSDLAQACEALGPKNRERYEDAIRQLSDLPVDTIYCGRGQRVPAWYRNVFNVNLADMPAGYALLETDGDKWQVHSRSKLEINQNSEPSVPGDA